MSSAKRTERGKKALSRLRPGGPSGEPSSEPPRERAPRKGSNPLDRVENLGRRLRPRVGIRVWLTVLFLLVTAFAGGLFGLPAVSGILYSNGAAWAGYLDPSRSLQTIANSWLDPSRSMAGQLLAQGDVNLSPVLSLCTVIGFICLGLGLAWYALSGDIDV